MTKLVIRSIHKYVSILGIVISLLLIFQEKGRAQNPSSNVEWIRPENGKDEAVWGIRNGIVVGLWPFAIEPDSYPGEGKGGGPRGLLRVGYEFKGKIYHINFIAVEPIVNGEIEFSEISPSKVDGTWGKLMWANNTEQPGEFYPAAKTRGTITHPDPKHPEVKELFFYVFMEQFLNGAHPYLKISIRNDRPEEIGMEIFNHKNSVPMERCALSATMGNYSRLRLLHLKEQIVDSRKLYQGYDDINFIEKDGYSSEQMLRDKNGDLIVLATSNETFSELSSWPQDPRYYARSNWRYRPLFKLTQFWRKESAKYDPSLHVRVNGRSSYWSGGSQDKSKYIAIPGGPAFENFEMREKYYPGQKFYFGISRKAPEDIIQKLAEPK